MVQFKTYLFLAALFFSAQNLALAEKETAATVSAPDDTAIGKPYKYDSASWTRRMLPELIIRPVGIVGSVTGVVLFVAGSPFSGLASIPEPHDAFKITYEDFVKKPFNFTFLRPLGDW